MTKILKSVMLVSFLGLTLMAVTPRASIAEDGHAEEGFGSAFYVNDPMGRNAVTFKSMAPLEDMVGTTGQISGHIMFDPHHPEKGGNGEFKVPVASLNTGIPLRDEHLRSSGWLDSEQYPMIILKISELRDVKPVKVSDEAQTYDVVASGEFTLHGQTRMVEFPGRLTYLKESEATAKRLSGHILAARSNFTITLADYGITGPEGMGIVGSKIGETIDIEVSIMGSTGSEAPGNGEDM